MRHGEAEVLEPKRDKERALSAIGITDCVNIGKYLCSKGYGPDSIICSNARRTIESSELVSSKFENSISISFSDSLYLSSYHDLLLEIQTVPSSVSTLLLIGHNPAIHNLVRFLLKSALANGTNQIARNFPPGSLAILNCHVESWQDLYSDAVILDEFLIPSDLR